MSYEIRADYSKSWLFPRQLEEWVKEDHPARFVRELVDALDLSEAGFRERQAPEGRPNYAADLLLKVWVYGYANGIRSPRRLERACRENVGLMWLTGLNEPDHNTLWRFWRDHRSALRKMFKLVVQVAVEAGLVEVVLHAVDGTKVLARGAKGRVRKREQIEQALQEVDEAVEEVMAEVERAAGEEQDQAGYRLPEGWKGQILERERLRELAAGMEASERKTIHEQEADARFMKTAREGTALAYNAQAVVDAGSGLIVAEDVVTDGSDHHQLVPMIDQVEQNVGRAAEETVADAGYCSGEQLDQAEQRGYGVLVNEQRFTAGKAGSDPAYDASRFRYDAEQDCLICPQEQALHFESVKSRGRRQGGEQVRVYRCAHFKQCPVRWQCSIDPKGRTVRLGRFHQATARQRSKRRVPDKAELLRKRREIVEAPFGWIKEGMGFRRFTVQGLEKVSVQWSLICLAVNLRKLYHYWRRGELVL